MMENMGCPDPNGRLARKVLRTSKLVVTDADFTPASPALAVLVVFKLSSEVIHEISRKLSDQPSNIHPTAQAEGLRLSLESP
jgi:hypothetical protein